MWLVLPTEDYVYDGSAKTLGMYYADGYPSLLEATDFDLTFSGNVNAGTATATFTGKNNYTGTVTEEFEICRRSVTLTSGSASKVYDGTALVKHSVAVSGDGFVSGEGATFSYTGTQTAVGSSANSFNYTLKSNTKAGNYTITKSTGTLTVTKASASARRRSRGRRRRLPWRASSGSARTGPSRSTAPSPSRSSETLRA